MADARLDSCSSGRQAPARFTIVVLLGLLACYLILGWRAFGNRAFILNPGSLIHDPFIKNPKLFGYLFTREPLPYTGFQFMPVTLVFLALLRRAFVHNVALWHWWLGLLQFLNASLVFCFVRLFTGRVEGGSYNNGRKPGVVAALVIPAGAAAVFLFLPANLIFVHDPGLMSYPLSMGFSLASLLVLQEALERRDLRVFGGPGSGASAADASLAALHLDAGAGPVPATLLAGPRGACGTGLVHKSGPALRRPLQLFPGLFSTASRRHNVLAARAAAPVCTELGPAVAAEDQKKLPSGSRADACLFQSLA